MARTIRERIGGNTKEPKYTLLLVIGVIPFAISLNNIAVMKKNDEITTLIRMKFNRKTSTSIIISYPSFFISSFFFSSIIIASLSRYSGFSSLIRSTKVEITGSAKLSSTPSNTSFANAS